MPRVEHNSVLYAKENLIFEGAPNAMQCLPMLEKVDETNHNTLSSTGTAPGKDDILGEVLECCIGTLTEEQHEILYFCCTGCCCLVE
jgi:hypothetical protein